MKDGSKRFSLTNNKKERILTGFLAMFILFTSLWPIRHLDQITTLGEEKQYWGATMSLLGQNWSYYMEGEMLISYGYSLILLPICFFIKNASFAYKVAFILNGCFWVLAYLCSVRVGKKY